MAKRKKVRPVKLDPVSFEILRHRIWAINEEACTTLRLVSGSPVANEAFDMNCAILSAEGQVFVVGAYITIHATSVDLVVQDILREYKENPGINENDMFLCNDPYVGAQHQNDAVVCGPIHWKGEIVGWSGAVIHQIDVGGGHEGQVQVGARDIFGEQPIVPPVKLVEGGVVRKDIEREYLRRSKLPQLTGLDLKAKIAAVNVTRMRIQELIKQRGLETYKALVNGIIDTTETRFRARLKEFPDGTWRHRSYIDYEGKIYTCVCAMTKEDDHLIFDFRGTDKQAPAVINAPYGSLVGHILVSTFGYLCYDIPWCPAGVLRAMTILSEEGTVVHAKWPAGVSKSTTAAGWTVLNLTSVTLAKMFASSPKHRDHFMSSWMGCMTVEELFGIDQRGQYFGGTILDSMAGGSGARSYKDGIDTGGILDSVSSVISNCEDYEFNYPILYLYRKQMPDTGGPGKFRGGAGISMLYIPHDVERIPTKIMHCVGSEQPESIGVAGGYPSCTNQFAITRNSNIRELLKAGIMPAGLEEVRGEFQDFPAITVTSLEKNDVYRCIAMGGAGYLDPVERDPQMVLRDVVNGLVTLPCARDIYGVIIGPETETVNVEATRAQRARIREERSRQ